MLLCQLPRELWVFLWKQVRSQVECTPDHAHAEGIFVTQWVGGFSQRAVPVRLGALPPCVRLYVCLYKKQLFRAVKVWELKWVRHFRGAPESGGFQKANPNNSHIWSFFLGGRGKGGLRLLAVTAIERTNCLNGGPAHGYQIMTRWNPGEQGGQGVLPRKILKIRVKTMPFLFWDLFYLRRNGGC